MKAITIKAITMYEPWASLLAIGAKKIETRSWFTNYRGNLLIHAGKGKPGKAFDQKLLIKYLFDKHGVEVKTNPGYIVASCSLMDCVKMTPEFIKQQTELELLVGNWEPGRYAWILENVSPTILVTSRGSQGLWKPNNQIIAEVFGQQPLNLI